MMTDFERYTAALQRHIESEPVAVDRKEPQATARKFAELGLEFKKEIKIFAGLIPGGKWHFSECQRRRLLPLAKKFELKWQPADVVFAQHEKWCTRCSKDPSMMLEAGPTWRREYSFQNLSLALQPIEEFKTLKEYKESYLSYRQAAQSVLISRGQAKTLLLGLKDNAAYVNLKALLVIFEELSSKELLENYRQALLKYGTPQKGVVENNDAGEENDYVVYGFNLKKSDERYVKSKTLFENRAYQRMEELEFSRFEALSQDKGRFKSAAVDVRVMSAAAFKVLEKAEWRSLELIKVPAGTIEIDLLGSSLEGHLNAGAEKPLVSALKTMRSLRLE